MPALDHAAAAAATAATTLISRDLFETPSGSSSINAKSILLLVFVAILPVLIVAGVVSWLLCCYGRDRGSKRGSKRSSKRDQKSGDDQQQKPPSASQIPQQDKELAAFLRPSPSPHNPYSQRAGEEPKRPARAHTRNDSMWSKESGGSARSGDEKGPAVPRGFV